MQCRKSHSGLKDKSSNSLCPVRNVRFWWWLVRKVLVGNKGCAYVSTKMSTMYAGRLFLTWKRVCLLKWLSISIKISIFHVLCTVKCLCKTFGPSRLLCMSLSSAVLGTEEHSVKTLNVRPSAVHEEHCEPSVTHADTELGCVTSATTISFAEGKGSSYWMQISVANWRMMYCR